MQARQAISDLGEVFRHLRQRGFTRVAGTAADTRVFEGPLRLHLGEIRIRLEVSNWDFQVYPRMQLLERPSFLPQRMTHIDSTGGFCYLGDGGLVLDRFNPAGSIELCLITAEGLLNDLIGNSNRQARDIQDEFLAYWGGIGLGSRLLASIGDIDPKATAAPWYEIECQDKRIGDDKLLVVSTSDAEVQSIAGAINGQMIKIPNRFCHLISSDVHPAAPNGILPKTVKELFAFLQAWDKTVHGFVQRTLRQDKNYLLSTHVVFAARCPIGWLGFMFPLDHIKRMSYRRDPNRYLQYLHKSGGATAVKRFSIDEIGARALYARNLQHRSLEDKTVVVIGCGAIGGYAAQSMARMGAGVGRGRLLIVDSDLLMPENLGRHWLGMNSLFRPKAIAAAEELKRQFPMSNIVGQLADVAALPNLFDADLIIDATGEEALSELVNGLHMQHKSPKPPVLYVWVLGNGEAVQGLWVDQPRFGCYRCLRQPAGQSYRQERFPVLNKTPEVRMLGCQASTPYSVSAPMHAAALATDYVGDWLQGSPSPRFRTRCRETADVRQVKNQDVSPINGCPACSKG